MNIYSKKQIWKRILFILALLIVGLSLWYSSILVDKISTEERERVSLWAQAIQRKAKLVNYTDKLFAKLRSEERKKVEQWLEATKRLASPDINSDFSFLSKIVQDNNTVPVILTDINRNLIANRNLDDSLEGNLPGILREISRMESMYTPLEINYYQDQKNLLFYKDSRLITELEKTFDDLQKSFISEVVRNSVSVPVLFTDSTAKKIIASGNIDSSRIQTPELSAKLIAEMSSENEPISIILKAGERNLIFYEDSWVLKQLRWYPLVQFIVVGFFILISYIMFSSARRMEQNQVWVGLAKETAHQLGTPLSSLMAWHEIIKEEKLKPELVSELGKDIERFQTITERFSKIGSKPVLEVLPIQEVIDESLAYMQSRSPKKVIYQLDCKTGATAAYNKPLFAWVFENLIRNSIDAMEGNGTLSISCLEETKWVHIDLGDTGKGIAQSKRKTVFEPGYTTKKRGWGLGLSLVKRIVEQYHEGKIVVLNSKLGEGTTFRISLPR